MFKLNHTELIPTDLDAEPWDCCNLPRAQAVCGVLVTEIQRYDSIEDHPRYVREVELMVDWAVDIASYALIYGNEEQVTVDGLLADLGTGGNIYGHFFHVTTGICLTSPTNAILKNNQVILDSSHPLTLEGELLTAERETLESTVGNLVASIGIAKLDQAITLWKFGQKLEASINVSMAWECALLAERQNSAILYSPDSVSLRMSEIARVRHSRDPKQLAKASVKECWMLWRTDTSRYSGKAQFARDMLTKFEVLISTKVIESWCLEWELEASRVRPEGAERKA